MNASGYAGLINLHLVDDGMYDGRNRSPDVKVPSLNPSADGRAKLGAEMGLTESIPFNYAVILDANGDHVENFAIDSESPHYTLADKSRGHYAIIRQKLIDTAHACGLYPHPVITVEASDANADEEGSDPGTWTITRVKGDPNLPLTVSFSFSGTADAGLDYTLNTTNPVTIAAGVTSVTVVLTPIDDSVMAEQDDTAILTLSPSTAYDIQTASATIIIADNDSNARPIANAGADKVKAFELNTVPWTPARLTSRLWLDATDYNGDGSVYADNTTLETAWQDKSGNDNDYILETGPTCQTAEIGGNAVIEILSGGYAGPAGAAMPAGQWTFTYAARALPSDSYGRLFDGHTGVNIIGYYNGYKRLLYLDGLPNGLTSGPKTTANVTDFEINSWVREANGDIRLYVNGALIYTFPNPTSDAAGIIFRICKTASQRIHCQVGDLIINNAALSSTERQNLEGYLAHKWGLLSKLPSNHPYKSAVPMTAGAAVRLDDASATDSDGDALAVAWSVVSKPAGSLVAFEDEHALNTTAYFYTNGTYVLRLAIDDGYGPVYDEVTIMVGSTSVTVNHAVPHAWLEGLNPAWSNDFEAAVLDDPDGDGFTTWQEYWSGTDPQDSNSYLRIESVQFSGTNVVLEWEHAHVGTIPPIVIQSTTNLAGGVWVSTGQKTPVNGVNSWSNSVYQAIFFRLAVTNAP